MTNKLPMQRLENIKKQIYLEHENFYENSLRKQYLEVERWQMKVEMISNMKNKEIKKKDDQLIELKNLQDKVRNKRMENCDFVHTLIKNSWIANLGNSFGCTTLNTEIEKRKSNTELMCSKFKEELDEINSILEGLNLKRRQEKKLIECTRKVNSIEHSIAIWNDKIMKMK